VITILDYGAGNLRSVQNTLEELGVAHKLASTPESLREADRILLPGVGHFGQMLRALDSLGVREALVERIRAGVPFLGICLGLQGLCHGSEEAEGVRGLGLFPETVRRFPPTSRVPQMGWNLLEPRTGSRLFEGLGPKPYVYFANSYYVPVTAHTAAACVYTETFTAVLESQNVCGVQFHPEKSGPVGLRIVRNWTRL